MIRPIREGEMDGVVDLWLRASLDTHTFIPAEHWKARAADMREIWLPLSDVLLGYFDDETGKLAGFMAMVGDVLAALFVDSPWRGHGVGSRLFSLAARMQPALSLTVYAANGNAVAFYERRGLVRVAERIEKTTGQLEWVMTLGKSAGFTEKTD